MRKLVIVALSIMMLMAFVACDDNAITRTVIADEEGFMTAVAEGGFYSIAEDLSLAGTEPISVTKDFDIALDGHKLSSKAIINVAGAEVVISGGLLDVANGADGRNTNAINLSADSSLTLDAVEFTSNINGIFCVNQNNNVTLNVVNGSSITAKGPYGIGTNASEPDPSQNVRILIDDSSVTSIAEGGDNTAILFNVNGGVTIINSTIKADRQAIVARGGEYSFRNSTFEVTGENTIVNEYLDGNWGSGNEVPLAAIVAGNRSSSAYGNPTDMELENVTITLVKDTNNASKPYHAIYVYQNNDEAKYQVSVTGTLAAESATNVNEDKGGATYSVTAAE